MGEDLNDIARAGGPDVAKRVKAAMAAGVPIRDPKPYDSLLIKQVDELQGQAIEPRHWFVDGWVPDRNVTSLYGSGGTGKSLLAMQLCTAGAVGADWLGMPVPQRKCLYLSCEDDEAELHRRQADINALMGIDFADFEGRYAWLCRPGDDSALMEFTKADIGRPTKFGRMFADLCRDEGYQFVVIDTVADVFAGNEIVRPQVRQFITYLRKIAMQIDGSVMLLAHPSVAGAKDHGYSGSTAWQGSVRSLLTFEHGKDEDSPWGLDMRILTRKKANYAKAGNELSLHYAAGMFHCDTRPSAAADPQQDFLDQEMFMSGLRRLLDQGLCPSASKRQESYAPKLMKRTLGRDFNGVDVGRLERAMAGMFEAGQIIVQQHRKGASPVTPANYDLKQWRRVE